jgi:YVTN family beta-propeller protein
VEFRVLGPLEVVDDGRVLRLGSGKQLAVVAFLLLHANEAVSVDRIVDELWGESPPPTAPKIVRNYVSLLRRELGDRLVTAPPGYLLRVEDGELDRALLERAVESGDLDVLTDALAAWRGPPLSQVAYEPFAQAEIARLEELRLAALEARLEALLDAGRHTSALPELEKLVQQHPLRERLAELLMLALYRSGRQAEALEVFQRARHPLDAELGIEPGPGLRELQHKILTHDESLGAPRPTLRTRAARRRLPLALAAVALALAAAAVVAFLATSDSASGLAEVPPNYVGVIDPETNTVAAAVPVGNRPGSVTAGGGWVWVANLEDRNLTKVDPRRRSPAADVSLADRTPTGLAVGAGAVWVAHGLRGELSRVEPTFGRVSETIRVTWRSSAGSVAVGRGDVWVVYGDSTLVRIEPLGMRRSRPALTGANPSAVVVGDGSVWVVNAGDSTVQRFDPSTFEEGSVWQVTVGSRPAGAAFGDGALWVANRGDDTVTRIEPGATSASSRFDVPVGDEPTAVAVGAGAVWVANSGDGTVSRIDPETRKVVETIDVGNVPAGIAVANGLVWVAVQAR